jgi:hypothetical protein
MSESFGAGDTVGPAPVPPEHAALARRLRAAEDRLFPLAMVDADRYQAATRLVGMLARKLGETCGSLDELANADAELRVWLGVLAQQESIPLGGLDPDLVIEAAMSQRFRGLLAEQVAELQRKRVEQARDAGERWAVLEEPDPASWGAGSARWVEVHVDTGALMVRSVVADPRTGRATYRLEVTADGVQADEFADRDAWLAATDQVRNTFESPS